MNVKRGEIYIVDFGVSYGSEQGGKRPAIIIQNDVGNHFSTTTLVIPISSARINNSLPTHIMVTEESLNLGKIKGVAMLEQIRVIDQRKLHKFVAEINKDFYRQILNAMMVATGFEEKSVPKSELV